MRLTQKPKNANETALNETALNLTQQTSDTGDDRSTRLVDTTDRRKTKLQVSLWSLLLLIATCCVWIGFWKARSDTAKVESRLVGLRLIARELVIDDPNKVAAIERYSSFYGQKIMELYIPELDGKHFEMRLAMDKIPQSNNFEPNQLETLKRVVLKPGKHVVEFQYDVGEQAVLTVHVDGETAIQEIRPKDWKSKSGGHTISSSVKPESKSFENDEIVQLIYRRFLTKEKPKGSFSAPDGPGAGIALWVQAFADSTEDNSVEALPTGLR